LLIAHAKVGSPAAISSKRDSLFSLTGIYTSPDLRVAVVTGGNRGIGLEICRQLASNGVLVVLTARDEKKGSQAVEELQSSGLSGVIFHRLDVADRSSVTQLAEFVKARFGTLDILVSSLFSSTAASGALFQGFSQSHGLGLGSSGEQCSRWWNNHRS
jgi:hypothetical protein